MTVNWGIAGTGRMADVFVSDFEHAADAKVVAVGSRRPGSAKEFAEKHAIPAAHGSYRHLVDDPDVDVIYIATPHPQHLGLARAAIEAGKGVLVEKAFTATYDGAVEVVELARQKQVFCMEAMWTRFQPVVVRARELIAAGEIGEVIMVQADLGAFRQYEPADRLFALELGGGVVLDLGVYVISIAQHFLGNPDRVTATGRRYPNGADASASILMSYDDGRSASVIASLESECGRRAVIIGTKGSIELAPQFHHSTKLIIRRNNGEPEEIDAPAKGRGYAHEIDEVNRCIAEGRTESDVMSLDDTLAVQDVMQQTLEQLGIQPSEDPGII